MKKNMKTKEKKQEQGYCLLTVCEHTLKQEIGMQILIFECVFGLTTMSFN